jgi:hypothetical protein
MLMIDILESNVETWKGSAKWTGGVLDLNRPEVEEIGVVG